MLHRTRAEVPDVRSLHVTLRVRSDVPSLRSVAFVREFRRSLAGACERGDFRVVHYSLLDDHVHLIVEASSKRDLECGMRSIGSRLGRAANRVFARSGRVLAGRYDAVLLDSPRQVHNALRYVLLNARKHSRRPSRIPRIDPASSGRWFEPWRERPVELDPIGGRREVAMPRSWLLRVGWRRYGPISLLETPGGGRR